METIDRGRHFSPNMHHPRTPPTKLTFDLSPNSIQCFLPPPPTIQHARTSCEPENTSQVNQEAAEEVVYGQKELLCKMMSELFSDEEPASITKTVLRINYSPNSSKPFTEETDSEFLFQSWRNIFNSKDEAALQGSHWPIFAYDQETGQEWSQLNLDKEQRSTYLSSSSSREQLPDYNLSMQKTAFHPALEAKRRSCPVSGCYTIDSTAIERDGRTTLMIRHIPNKYTEQMLFRELPRRFREAINFLYLPLDAYNDCNMGYAFVNFIHTGYIRPFLEEFSGRKWSRFNSGKICELAYARIQGATSLATHFPETGRRRGKTENSFSAQHTNPTP